MRRTFCRNSRQQTYFVLWGLDVKTEHLDSSGQITALMNCFKFRQTNVDRAVFRCLVTNARHTFDADFKKEMEEFQDDRKPPAVSQFITGAQIILPEPQKCWRMWRRSTQLYSLLWVDLNVTALKSIFLKLFRSHVTAAACVDFWWSGRNPTTKEPESDWILHVWTCYKAELMRWNEMEVEPNVLSKYIKWESSDS